MKAHRKIHRLALGVAVIGVLAAVAASPVLAQPPGGAAASRHAKASAHKKKGHRRSHRRVRARLSAVKAISATATVVGDSAGIAGVSAALKPSGGGSGSSSGCPSANTLANFQVADNVGASFESKGSTTTYTFVSYEDEEPVGGVPGLVKYCVYPEPSAAPTKVDVVVKGANSATWASRKDSGGFAFARPGGDKSNIPLDGSEPEMGSATWSTTAPETQTILLHINDPRACTRFYGAEAPGTCFVKPGEPWGPVCDAGLTDIAYSSMPLDIFNGCPPRASEAFEAQQTSEFGDEVKLTGSGDLESLVVTLMSYGCGDEGHWNLGTSDPCVTTPGEEFETEITGRIYDATGDTVGEQLAEVKKTFSIPYRPSAEPTVCPEAPESGTEWQAGSKFRDPVSGLCLLALPLPIEFAFPSAIEIPTSGKVIWTVAFNTTHYGYNPIGESATCFTSLPGCGYDSLNVGTWSFPGAPYSGEDVNAEAVFWAGAPSNVLGALGSGWAPYKPLAEIRLQP